jgi:hypothetical protein
LFAKTDRVEVHRESLRSHRAAGPCCGEFDRDVVRAGCSVDARHDAWHKSQVRLVDIVNEDVVTDLELVPLQSQHH